MVNFGEAFKRPFEKMVIGIILNIIPIVNFLSTGYLLQVAKTAKKKELPEWVDWGNLFIRGFIAEVIKVIYFLPAIIVFIATLGTAILSVLLGSSTIGKMAFIQGLTSMGSGLFVFVVLFLLAAYIVPAAWTNYAIKGKFGSAFALKEITAKAFTGNYFVAWLTGTIYSCLVLLFAILTMAIAAPMFFVTRVTLYTLIGDVFTSK